MDRIFTEDDYVRCDILTGRLYRCLTSLFQEFLDIRFSEVFGSQWMKIILRLAREMPGGDWKTEKDKLRQLTNKKSDVLVDVSSIDVTIASTLMIYVCYYFVTVPQCKEISGQDMADILHKFESKPLTEYQSDDEVSLRRKLIECVKKEAPAGRKSGVNVIIDCAEKLAKRMPKSGTNNQQELKKNFCVQDRSFINLVQALTDGKNKLNSHMSVVTDPIYAEKEIAEMIVNIDAFLDYLDATWEYPMKNDFLEKYRKEISIIRYLRSTPQFSDVTSAIYAVISTMTNDRTASESDDAEKSLNNETHLMSFKRCFSLLSNANNHCVACTALVVESDTLENPCATIMLAFMYYCGWATGHTAEEILMPLSVVFDPTEWLPLAEKLKTQSKEEEKTDNDLSVLHRAQATAYYIGHAMLNKAPSAFMMAGYLGIMLENFEITKACFQYAGESDKKANDLYNAFSNMQDETVFQKWASIQNKRRLDK